MAEKAKIYVDSACFIDLVKYKRGMRMSLDDQEEARRKDDCWFLRRLCDASRDGVIQLFTSMLSVAECLHIGETDGRPSNETKDLFVDFLTSGTVVDLIDPDIFVAERARSLWWDFDIRIKGADAIHVATAMLEGCNEFLTLDGRIRDQGTKFAKAVPAIAQHCLPVKRPSATGFLPEKYRTDDIFAEAPPAQPT